MAVLLSAGMAVANLLVSSGAMWLAFWLNVVWAVVLLTTATTMAPRYGALGLALSYLVSYAVHTALQLAYFWASCRKMVRVDAAPAAVLAAEGQQP